MPRAPIAKQSSLSAVDALINESAQAGAFDGDVQLPNAPEHHHLAIQVLHNLRYQHDWTDLKIHAHTPLAAGSRSKDASGSLRTDSVAPHALPRPMISGFPPRRIYIHPDEQIAHIKDGIKEKDLPREREWVLPTRIREKWSLKKFAEVFNEITVWPPEPEQEENGPPTPANTTIEGQNKWRILKRVLLATVDDDSTVVYYIVHDGIVKPRQN
ncbi:MAG: hypothetical protein M1831_000254 [Alyxoria varia]|nr:MAG: hypothetical protein M1831_000254 [Alyxoria varia]